MAKKKIEKGETIKRLIIILGLLNVGVGSIMNNNTLIVVGTILGIVGAMMLLMH